MGFMPEQGSQPTPIASIFLMLMGMMLIFVGVCIGIWVLVIASRALFEPESMPLVGKVLTLVEKDEAFFEQVKTETGVKYQGAAIRYGILMVVLIVIFSSFGSVLRAFITAGSSMIQAASPKRGSRETESKNR